MAKGKLSGLKTSKKIKIENMGLNLCMTELETVAEIVAGNDCANK